MDSRFIDWKKYAIIAEIYIPKEEDFKDAESESSYDSKNWQPPVNHRYENYKTHQKLLTTQEIFHDTIKLVIRPAIKYIEGLYFNKNKVIDTKGQIKIL